MKKISYKKLTIAVIVIASILRILFALSHSVSGDACWHLSVARFMAAENKIPLYEGLGRLEPFWAPPVFHFSAALLYKIFNVISANAADLGARLASPIFGILTIFVSYLIIRKLADEKTAFYAMIFIGFLPLSIDYNVLGYVESAVAFFSVLSVYFMLNNRIILSAISIGLALLSKYNAIFFIPMLIYLAYAQSKDKKSGLSRIAVYGLVSVAVSATWFIRNYILLKNPVWPFLNDVFHGVAIGTYFSTTDYKPLFYFKTYLNSYLELFGVPNGNLELLTFVKLPFIKFLVLAWLMGTFIFFFPFIRGFFKIKFLRRKHFAISLYILLLFFAVQFVVYVLSLGWFGSRLLLPIIPFMGLIWAIGLRKIKIEEIYVFIILIICIGFVFAEAIKFHIAAKEWGVYSKDFEWARENTNQNDLFYGNGQCLPYNINRLVVSHKKQIDFSEVDYAWVNNKWKIDFLMDNNALERIKSSDKLDIVYSNPDSGTIIYKSR